MKANREFAKKCFGQNFLVDPLIIQKIITNLNLQKDDLVVEIGPGRGALSQLVIPQVAKFYGVEIDRDLSAILEEKYRGLSNVQIINTDALTFGFSSFPQKVRLIGNLPYNISSPLLFHFLASIKYISDMHFMLQKEVAFRIAAKVHDTNYGRLSIMIQHLCDVEYLFDVSSNAFLPKPKVESAFIRLIPKKEPLFCPNYEFFEEIVKEAFSKRRKQIKNALEKFFTIEDLEKCNVNPTWRPEDLEYKDYINLASLKR